MQYRNITTPTVLISAFIPFKGPMALFVLSCLLWLIPFKLLFCVTLRRPQHTINVIFTITKLLSVLMPTEPTAFVVSALSLRCLSPACFWIHSKTLPIFWCKQQEKSLQRTATKCNYGAQKHKDKQTIYWLCLFFFLSVVLPHLKKAMISILNLPAQALEQNNCAINLSVHPTIHFLLLIQVQAMGAAGPSAQPLPAAFVLSSGQKWYAISPA